MARYCFALVVFLLFPCRGTLAANKNRGEHHPIGPKRKVWLMQKSARGTSTILTLNPRRVRAFVSATETPETANQTRRRFARRGYYVLAVVPGAFFNPQTLQPVGRNCLKGRTTPMLHPFQRPYLLVPHRSKETISFATTWPRKLLHTGQFDAVEMGVGLIPAMNGGFSRGWCLRETPRYVIGCQQHGLVVIFDPKGSISQLRRLCHKLKLRFAAVADGGSSVVCGTPFHIVLVAKRRQ